MTTRPFTPAQSFIDSYLGSLDDPEELHDELFALISHLMATASQACAGDDLLTPSIQAALQQVNPHWKVTYEDQ